jgi:hypothetical protein
MTLKAMVMISSCSEWISPHRLQLVQTLSASRERQHFPSQFSWQWFWEKALRAGFPVAVSSQPTASSGTSRTVLLSFRHFGCRQPGFQL